MVAGSGEGPRWQVDATPSKPGYKSPTCSVNYNNGKNYVCPALAGSVSGSLVSPLIDASQLDKGEPLTLTFQLGGEWESGSFDNLDLQVSLDGKDWGQIDTYDGPGATSWALQTVDLSDLNGVKFWLRWRFWTKDCDFNESSGAFIDDVKLFVASCQDETECDDGDPCSWDACNSGVCEHGDSDGPCDDGDHCTDDDQCEFGGCTGLAKACDDGESCTTDSCDGLTGQCGHVTKADDALCTDGNSCTSDDAAGVCTGKVADDGDACADGDLCTAGDTCKGGVCEPGEPLADGEPCDDDDVCTTDDTCTNGACAAQGAACDDGDGCTVDSCKDDDGDPACDFQPVNDGISCDDGDACTLVDVCKFGECKGTAQCEWQDILADSFACDEAGAYVDGSFTIIDEVAKGQVGWHVDGLPNPPGFQSPACSLNFNNDIDYDDGTTVAGVAVSKTFVVPATGSVRLQARSYNGVEDDEEYDWRFVEISSDDFDQDVTTIKLDNSLDRDTWSDIVVDLAKYASQTVSVRFRFDSQDEEVNETPGWFIDDVAVSHGTLPEPFFCQKASDCPDNGDPCVAEVCIDYGCRQAFTDEQCDDDSACTSNDYCNDGACMGDMKSCDDGDACTDDGCLPLSGECTFSVSDCGDDNACTSDSCDSDFGCEYDDISADCVDDEDCTSDGCDPVVGCVYAKDTGSGCDDGLKCTSDDACDEGVCKGGAPPTCTDGNACTEDACNEADGCNNPAADGAVCLDATACDDASLCDSDTCVAGAPVDCDDKNPCTTDSCPNPGAIGDGCVHDAVEDGTPCGVASICSAGQCVVPPIAKGAVVITEIMFDPSKVNDDEGEWFEIHNPGETPIDLEGMVVKDKTKSHAIKTDAGSLILPAKGYLVLGVNDDDGTNGGVKVDYVYGSLALVNTNGSVSLENGDASLIDIVAYRTNKQDEGWPGKSVGAAYAFGRAAIDADDNDLGGNWCVATQTYGLGNFGTPGEANPKCFVDWCRMQWPLVQTAKTNSSATIRWYGHVHLKGVTDKTQGPDENPTLVGAVGIGPLESDPHQNSDWSWTEAVVNPVWDDDAAEEPGNDEYQADAKSPKVPAAYSVAYRFSFDGGWSWTYCDRNFGPGADGSADGYQVNRASLLKVETP